jgi:DNA-binding response OmpR family regulator
MPRVLNVGQCGFDHVTIGRHLRKAFNADLTAAASFPQALDALRAATFDLVLVNRVTDGDGTLGIDLIRAMKRDPQLADLPVMLVSNFPEAQAEALSLGAMPGFGKSEMSSAKTRERLQAVLGVGQTP